MLNNFNTGLWNSKASCEGGFFIDYRVQECNASDFCDTVNSTFS